MKDTHSGECVAGVRDEHTRFPDGAIADGDTLYEPRSAHPLNGAGKSQNGVVHLLLLGKKSFLLQML